MKTQSINSMWGKKLGKSTNANSDTQTKNEQLPVWVKGEDTSSRAEWKNSVTQQQSPVIQGPVTDHQLQMFSTLTLHLQ